MKKVLLINPPFYRLMGSHHNNIPLGLSYLGSYLNEHGHSVGIYNTDYISTKSYLNQAELFENYEKYTSALKNLDLPIWGEIEEKIKNFNPEYVGITILTGNYKSANNIAYIVKKINPRIVVIAGGAHPTALPEQTIANENIDFVLRGEGELSLLDIVNGKNPEEIPNLTFIKNGKVHQNPKGPLIEDINGIPFPLRDEKYFINGIEANDLGSIITSRGCPFSCTFCSSKVIWGQKVRFRSPENVVAEIEELYNKHHVKTIKFYDDALTANLKRARKIFELMIEKNLKVSWICDTRADRLTPELLDLMKKSGCIRVKIGVESGSEEILKKIKKGEKKNTIRKAVRMIKQAGLKLTTYLMIGFPGEKREQIQETLDFAKELDPDYYSLSIVTPYYGTELYNEFIEQGNLPEDWIGFYHQSKKMIESKGIDPDIIEEFLCLNDLEGKSRT